MTQMARQPNYSFKGNQNRSDFAPLNSGVRPLKTPMSIDRVVTLRHPVLAGELEPSLEPGGWLQCSESLEAVDCGVVNAFLEKNPDLALRIYKQPGTEWNFNLQFIASLPALRHLWLVAEAGDLNDLAVLRSLPQGLKSLILDTVARYSDKKQDKPKTHVEVMSRLSELEDLAVCGRLTNIDFLASMTALRTLGLWRNKLKSLTGIGSAGNLEHLVLKSPGPKSVAPLRDLKRLKSLEVWDQRNLSDLRQLSALPDLARLWILSCGNNLPLPSFQGFGSLRVLVLHSNSVLENLASISQAPALQCLVLSNSPIFYSVESLEPLAGHPTLRELRICSNNDRLKQSISDRYGWKVEYSNFPSDEYLV